MASSLTELDNLELNLSSGNLTLLNIILGIVMFGVAIGIEVDDFKQVIRKPKSIVVGLIGQLLLLPLLTAILIYLFNDWISPGIAMGMILVASCPGGNISNFMVHLAKGNTALSVSMTAFSTLFAVVLTPFNFYFWGNIYTDWIMGSVDNPLLQNLEIDIVEVGKSVFLLLGLPLLVGMLFAKYYPKAKAKIEGPLRKFSILAFIAIVVIAFSKNTGAFLEHISAIFTIVLIHNAAVISGGWIWSGMNKLPYSDRKSVSIEMGIQNSGLGLVLLLNPNIFPAHLPIGGMAAITAWWGIWHIVAGLTLAYYWRRHPSTLKSELT